jgi:hypothetical protein
MIRPLTLFAMLALVATPFSLSAQVEEERDVAARPLLGVHLGYAGIEKAKNTIELGASAEIGSYRTPRLRFVLGLDYLSSETTRPPRPAGSFSDLSVNGDLRFKPFQVRTVAPYLGGGLGLHFRSNDYGDPNIADIYDGVAVGVQGFVGVLVDGADTGRWGFSGEFRAVRAKDLHRSSLRAGLFLRL